MTIRQANESDTQSVLNLLGQLGYSDFDEEDVKEKIHLHSQPGYRMLVSETEQQVVAFASLHWFELAHWKGRMGRISSFCVDEHSRSKGIGQQLLKAIEKLFLDEGCVKIEVTSNIRRERAHEFYLKAGYVEDSKRFVKMVGGLRGYSVVSSQTGKMVDEAPVPSTQNPAPSSLTHLLLRLVHLQPHSIRLLGIAAWHSSAFL